VVRNNVEAGVLEPALSKTKMIQVCMCVWGGECVEEGAGASSEGEGV
jgi:hypothetical protein